MKSKRTLATSISNQVRQIVRERDKWCIFCGKQNQIEKYTDKLENVGSYFWSKVYINLETREINATPMESQEYISYETLNTLYDLIQAGLVEKSDGNE